LEEQKLVLKEIQEIADRKEVDLILLAGDIFDTFNPSHEAVELLYKSLKRLTNGGKRPIIAISGNHDSTQFIEAPDPLAREMGIFFYGKYENVIPCGKLESGIEITQSAAGFIEMKLPQIDFPVRIILAPYANEVSLKTYLGEGDREAEFRGLLEKNWETIADTYCDERGVNLFAGHFFFMKEGSTPEVEPESERPILHVGGTQALFTKNIPSQIQYAALGHLHRYHRVGHEHCPVVYASSPLAYSFSEADQQKQVILIEAQPDEPVTYTPIGLKQGRPLYRMKFEELTDAILWLEANPYCFVEITFVTEHSIDAATRKAIMKAHDGIVNLIPQIKNPSGRDDFSLQVSDLSKDMESLFKLFYESEKGQEPNAELLDIFKEVISQNDEA